MYFNSPNAYVLVKLPMTIPNFYYLKTVRAKVISGVVALMLLTTTFTLQGCDRTSTSSSKKNGNTLVLVIIDTVGYNRVLANPEQAPFLRSLTRSSAIFTNAFSTAPWTKPSIASILTGVYPLEHGVRHPKSRIKKNVPTMAELFGELDYATAGVVSHVFLAPRTDYKRGFQSYQLTSFSGHVHDSITAEQVTTMGLDWLKQQKKEKKQNKLLFLHYFDPHYNYKHHPRFDRTSWYNGDLNDSMKFGEFKKRKDTLSADDLRYIRGLYEEEVLETDQELRRLYKGITDLGLQDETTLIITADHGEAFNDHNHLGHGYQLYNELIHVPLIVHAPKRIAAQTIHSVVSTMDILPTLLDLTGHKERATTMHGVSFAPTLLRATKDQSPARLAISELHYHTNRISGVLWPWKGILDKDTQTWEFFNIEVDPGERNVLKQSDLPTPIASSLTSAITKYDSGELVSHSKEEESEIEYSAEELEVLKTLGYAM